MIEQSVWNEFQQGFIGDSRLELMMLAGFVVILVLGTLVGLVHKLLLIRYKECVGIRGGFYRDCFGEVLDQRWFVWYTVSIGREGITTTIGRWHLSPRRGRLSQKLRRKKLGKD